MPTLAWAGPRVAARLAIGAILLPARSRGAALVVTSLEAKNVHRAQWQRFRDVLTLPKSPRGEQVDRILTDLITKLERSGRLEKLFARVHSPYKDWQPADMGW